MALLTVQPVTLTGMWPTLTAAAVGGNQFPNSGTEFLFVRNAHTAPITVTINSITPCNQGFDHDLVVSVPNATDRFIGPFPKARFDDVNGQVLITYSLVTALSVAAVRVA